MKTKNLQSVKFNISEIKNKSQLNESPLGF